MFSPNVRPAKLFVRLSIDLPRPRTQVRLAVLVRERIGMATSSACPSQQPERHSSCQKSPSKYSDEK